MSQAKVSEETRPKEIEVRVKAATPGPWASHYDERGLPLGINGLGCWPWKPANVEFIANAREDIPWLLKRLKIATEALEDIFRLIDEGFLGRDISRDHEPDWAMKAAPYLMRLKQCQEALRRARGDK